MKKHLIYFCLYFFVVGNFSFSQQQTNHDELLRKVKQSDNLFKDNPEKSFVENEKILREAIDTGNKEVELYALNNKCRYFEKKYDFKNMISSAEDLYKKAESYKSIPFMVDAKNYLFKAYAFNGLYEKGYNELNAGKKLIENVESTDSAFIEAKSNLYISFSNYYLLKKDSSNRLKYIKLSIKEHEKFKNETYKEKLRYLDYSNLATVFNEIDLDSAEYYAKLSISKNKDYNFGNVEFSNLIVLGQINKKRKDYEQALFYLKEAENIKDFKNHLNTDILYQDIIDIYTALNDNENAKIYKDKKDLLKLNVTENQNKSLHKMLSDKEAESRWYRYILITLMLIALFFLFLFLRKTWILSKQEKISQQYLLQSSKEAEQENLVEVDYSKLLNMFKKNDLAFITYFNEVYPDFSQKLIQINPSITQSEIEFSAYLKLKIPTKDIVRFRNLAHRTVQNKKYILRKKLNIPTETDIYQWFDSF